MTLGHWDVTPKDLFLNRRRFLAAAGAGAGLGLAGFSPARAAADLTPTSKDAVTSYNNFYEFGTDKEDPARNAGSLTLSPWSVEVGGLVERPGTYALTDLLTGLTVEERIYRFRCVEAWAMVVPWNGVPLAAVLEKVGIAKGARYVAFETLYRPEEMPGQASPILDWPYREGLRLDEAQHPLTLLATGLYGESLPPQNGAPLRLVVPWKYGFKSIKSIVRITLTADQPPTTWNQMAPEEYGFYANVNPAVDHPRWSQASERVVGSGLFGGRQDTLPFNGYEAEVAGLYAGMDLRQNY